MSWRFSCLAACGNSMSLITSGSIGLAFFSELDDDAVVFFLVGDGDDGGDDVSDATPPRAVTNRRDDRRLTSQITESST